jgi:hypothetical protein
LAAPNHIQEREVIACGGASMLIDVVVVVLVLMLIGAFPTWPYSRSWGYYPTGGLGLILAIVVVLLLLHVF